MIAPSPDLIDGIDQSTLIAWSPERPRGGRRLSIIVNALRQHWLFRLWRSPPLPRAHRDRRTADRPDRDRYGIVRCHERASGFAHAEHLDSPHADAAARPAATFLAAQPP